MRDVSQKIFPPLCLTLIFTQILNQSLKNCLAPIPNPTVTLIGVELKIVWDHSRTIPYPFSTVPIRFSVLPSTIIFVKFRVS